MNDDLKFAIEKLLFDAKRIDFKFGHYEDGTPKDWTEWKNLRESIEALKRLTN